MHFATLSKVIGLLLIVFSLSQLPPIFIDLIYSENQYIYFVGTFAVTLIVGAVLYLPFRGDKNILRIRESIFLVVSFWVVLSLIGTIPFMLSPATSMSFIDSFFESMSGLSTTGATVLTGLDELPRAILYYRQQLQWLGGMGIIVLAVAILPIFGISNIGLFKAETSNLSSDRITPKLTQTAKGLWVIYVLLTILCALFYYLAGMGWFDAISHSFSTIAIGGFSTHDNSIAYFNSPNIEIIAIIFMVLAGINFSLHLIAWHNKSLKSYFKDSELKTYILVLLIFIIITFLVLDYSSDYSSKESFRYSLFNVVSFATTTGFTSTDFSAWPVLLPSLLVFFSFIGACSGSTGGGIKVVRVLLMLKLGTREIKKLLHPSAQINIKIGGNSLPGKVLISVWGFFALYAISFIFIMILLMFSGVDHLSSFAATAATINNLGPGIGDVANHYRDINDFAKVVLTFAMLLGRLEILTLLAILHRAFWRF